MSNAVYIHLFESRGDARYNPQLKEIASYPGGWGLRVFDEVWARISKDPAGVIADMHDSGGKYFAAVLGDGVSGKTLVSARKHGAYVCGELVPPRRKR